ncbi:MAG: hypothetical protein Ct9H300mP21_09370 [Pseudomonadota bacterium]|nr:MAG: hypothetical protein Ct9H300mP21_09370 [Pseudomonadota bacterium]
MTAPEVIAKGADHLAFRMRTVARENNVPILERPELARDLYANVEIGDDIPERFIKQLQKFGLRLPPSEEIKFYSPAPLKTDFPG